MNTLLHLALLLAPLTDPRSSVVVIGSGGGVVIDTRGYVVTCLHVVGEAPGAVVRTFGDQVYLGRVLARDEEAELAMLWLDAPGRRFVPLRLTDRPPRVLEPVTVIGHPKGFDWTVSAGRVTALGRSISFSERGKLHGLLQCDANINPGNSGGAVLDRAGRLAGLPVAIREGATNLGFVIPAAALRRFLDTHLPK